MELLKNIPAGILAYLEQNTIEFCMIELISWVRKAPTEAIPNPKTGLATVRFNGKIATFSSFEPDQDVKFGGEVVMTCKTFPPKGDFKTPYVAIGWWSIDTYNKLVGNPESKPAAPAVQKPATTRKSAAVNKVLG